MAPALATIPAEIRRAILEQLLIQHPRFGKPASSLVKELFEHRDDEEDEGAGHAKFLSDFQYDIAHDVKGEARCYYLDKAPELFHPKRGVNLGAFLRTDLGRTAINITECSAGILRACRAFYNEGNHLLYEKNVFDLTAFCQDTRPCPYQGDLMTFPDRIGLHNFQRIQHVDIDMHYLLERLVHVGMLLTRSDLVSDGGMFEKLLLDPCRPTSLPRLQSLNIHIPYKSRGGLYYHWSFRAHLDDVDYYRAHNLAPAKRSEMDPLTELLVFGTRDHDTFIDFLIYHIKDSLVPGSKPSYPKAYTTMERDGQLLLLTNNAMPAEMLPKWKEFDVPELQRRFEGEETEIRVMEKPLAAKAREFERENGYPVATRKLWLAAFGSNQSSNDSD